jgi:hypothetical protein
MNKQILKANQALSGNSLMQYAIIIVLIALFVVPVYIQNSQHISSIFEKYTTSYQSTAQEMQKNLVNDKSLITEGKVMPGQLGGTYKKPVVKCIENNCAVDFGDFVFNNIPKNYKEFVESSGYSGGTAILASVMEEISNQAAYIADAESLDLIKQLAMTGHQLADIERSVEEAARETIDSGDSKVKNKFIMPSQQLSNGQDRTLFEKTLNNLNEQLDSINDPERAVIKELVNVLAFEIIHYADETAEMTNTLSNNKYTIEELEAIIASNASTITHLDSTIICISGDNVDSGEMCY